MVQEGDQDAINDSYVLSTWCGELDKIWSQNLITNFSWQDWWSYRNIGSQEWIANPMESYTECVAMWGTRYSTMAAGSRQQKNVSVSPIQDAPEQGDDVTPSLPLCVIRIGQGAHLLIVGVQVREDCEITKQLHSGQEYRCPDQTGHCDLCNQLGVPCSKTFLIADFRYGVDLFP